MNTTTLDRLPLPILELVEHSNQGNVPGAWLLAGQGRRT